MLGKRRTERWMRLKEEKESWKITRINGMRKKPSVGFKLFNLHVVIFLPLAFSLFIQIKVLLQRKICMRRMQWIEFRIEGGRERQHKYWYFTCNGRWANNGGNRVSKKDKNECALQGLYVPASLICSLLFLPEEEEEINVFSYLKQIMKIRRS